MGLSRLLVFGAYENTRSALPFSPFAIRELDPPKIISICLIIQSLMDDMPYHNEPGFEKEAWEQSRSRGTASATQLAEVFHTNITAGLSVLHF